MNGYLVDTNICIYYLKGRFQLDKRFEEAGFENCFISEITLAELKYGVENSERIEKNRKVLEGFVSGLQVIPIFHSLDLYASEKARLRKKGRTVDDFDLLIGVSSVTHNLKMVTRNRKDFEHIQHIEIVDWTKN